MNLKQIFAVLKCSVHYWSKDNVSTTGAALAYYCAFSIAPLLVILLSVAGLVLGQEGAYRQMGGELTALFGASTSKILLTAAKSSQHTNGLISTVTSVVTLLIGATTVLNALQSALNLIWRSGSLVKSGVWGFIQARFLSLGFILALGFLLLVSLTLSTALAQVQHHVGSATGVWVILIAVVDFLVSLSLVSALFTAIFRYMPARHTPWKWSLLGGVMTAALFEAGRWAIGLYLAHSSQPSAFGAAASFAAMLLWLYYTAQIFLFGAEFTACAAGLRDDEDAQVPVKPVKPVEPARQGN
jgi:membrane protein